MVRLPSLISLVTSTGVFRTLYLCPWISVMVRIGFVFLYFLWKLLPNALLRHFLAHSGMELAHLRALANLITFLG